MYLKNYLKYGRKINSIEFDGTLDNYQINVVSAKLSGNSIKEKTEKSFESIKSAADNIKNKHGFLTISGPQVLIKIASKKSDHMEALSETFPNLDLNKMYYQIWESENNLLIALTRKKFIDNVITTFSDHKVYVIGGTLSFLSIQNILEWIDLKSVPVGHFTIEHTNGKFNTIRNFNHDIIPEKYNLQDEIVKSPFLIAFSGISNYFTKESLVNSNLKDRNRQLYNQFLEHVFFRKFLTVSLSFLCLILLINYLLYSSYYNQYNDLQTKKNIIQESASNYELLQKSRTEKWQVLENIKSNTNSQVIPLLNKLLAEKPDEISLTEMTYQPILGSVVGNDPINLQENELHLKGITTHNTILTNWFRKLEGKEWIENIKISDFINNSNSSEFSIVIYISHDAKK